MNRTHRYRFAVAFLLLIPSILAASNPAKLSGVVTDPSGAGIAGVRIRAQAEGSPTQEAVTAVTGENGRYSLELAAGRYRLRFEKEPFKAREIELQLAADEQRSADLRLEVEPLSARVVVTAQAEPVETDASPAPADVFTRKEIDAQRAVILTDLLQFTQGVSIGRTGAEGGLASVFLNGGNSNFTKVLVDGTPVNEPGSAVDFSNFTLDNVDKVEIVRGAESAIYGTDAVAGVIQIFTHRGTTRTPSLEFFSEGGSFTTAREGAQASGLLGKFDYSGAAAYFGTDGQGPNDAMRNRTLSGNFGWRFSEGNQLRLTLRDNTSDAGVPGQTLFEPPNLDQNAALHSFSAGQAWQFTTGPRWRHEIRASQAFSRDLEDNPGQDFYNPFDPYCPQMSATAAASDFCDYTYTVRNEYNRNGFTAQTSYLLPKIAMTAGYQFEEESGYLWGYYSGFETFMAHRRQNQGGFLDLRWTPLSKLLLSAGARAEANGNFGTRVTPRLGASYVLYNGKGFWGDTRARFFYGQGVKEPRFDQSFGTDPCSPGNPDLRPERSRTWSAGIEQKMAADRMKFSAEYFHSSFYDMVSYGSAAPPPSCPYYYGTFFNTDLARARGTNLSVEAQPLSWLSIAGSYSYDDSRVLAAPNAWDPALTAGNRLFRRPVNAGSLRMNASYRRLNLNLAGYFTGRRTDSDFLYLGYTQNPGYTRIDFAGSYNFGRGLAFYSRVANLLDKQYQDALGYPALGREFRAGMRYRFGGKGTAVQ